MRIIAAVAAAVAFFAVTAPGQAGFLFNVNKSKLVATVSLSEQTMVLDVTDRRGNTRRAVWQVSTGKQGFETPTGTWRAKWLSKDHKSKTYDDAPMPNAVFFVGGYAIHGTDAVARLGKPASHGCVRLAPENAETFFDLVSAYGKWNTKIIVVD